MLGALNLQAASVVVNCDLPWNPARLEQRIARAWRKHQARPVTVINLISESTIEHRMLSTLAAKQSLAEGVLDRRGDLTAIKLTSGRQSFLAENAMIREVRENHARDEFLCLLIDLQFDVVVSGGIDVEFRAEVFSQQLPGFRSGLDGCFQKHAERCSRAE